MQLETQLCKALVEHGFEILEITPLQLHIRNTKDGAEASISLSNLYRQIYQLGFDQQLTIKQFLRKIIFTMNGKKELQLDHLLPRILPFTKKKTAAWTKDLLPGVLELSYVIDDGHQLRFLKPLDIPRTGKSLVELSQIALENLRRITNNSTPVFHRGIYLMEKRDGFDAARALLAEQWFVNSQGLYIAIPSRDTLWIFPRIGEEKLPAGLRIALGKAYTQLAYPLSEQWFLLHEGRFSIA